MSRNTARDFLLPVRTDGVASIVPASKAQTQLSREQFTGHEVDRAVVTGHVTRTSPSHSAFASVPRRPAVGQSIA